MMVNAEETRRNKAKNLRYKKPIVKSLNLDAIKDDLWDIQSECEEVRWYTDSEDGNDSLINALAGDEEEAYEFKMAFADLCAECDRMWNDLFSKKPHNMRDLFKNLGIEVEEEPKSLPKRMLDWLQKKPRFTYGRYKIKRDKDHAAFAYYVK